MELIPKSSWTNVGSLGEPVREYCLPQQNKPETLQGLALETESPSTEGEPAEVPPSLYPPDSTCPLGLSQCDHRCPPCSHLASAQPPLLVSLSRGETCWNLQSTFLNTKGDLWGRENKEAKELQGAVQLTESVGQQGWPKFSQTSWLWASLSWQRALSSPPLRPSLAPRPGHTLEPSPSPGGPLSPPSRHSGC